MKRLDVVGALVGFALVGSFLAKEAHATNTWWRREAGYGCFPVSYLSTIPATPKMGSAGGSLSVANGDGANSGFLACPIVESKAEPKTSIQTFHVEVIDNSTTDAVSAQVCVGTWNAAGGSCGTAATSDVSGTGHYSLHPDISKLDALDFGYVEVTLPEDPGGGVPTLASILTGLYWSDGTT